MQVVESDWATSCAQVRMLTAVTAAQGLAHSVRLQCISRLSVTLDTSRLHTLGGLSRVVKHRNAHCQQEQARRVQCRGTKCQMAFCVAMCQYAFYAISCSGVTVFRLPVELMLLTTKAPEHDSHLPKRTEPWWGKQISRMKSRLGAMGGVTYTHTVTMCVPRQPQQQH